MERAPDHVPCDAKICKHWNYFYKGCTGCVYINVALNSQGQCKSFKRKKKV